MNRLSDFAVGLTVLIAAIVVVVAAIWLGQVGAGGERSILVARFRTMGGVGVGDPVVLRGVTVGRVESIRLEGDDWVEADLRLGSDAPLPADPVALASSASLFGEWQVALLPRSQALEDPAVRQLILSAAAAGRDAVPGATLPDIGYLTQQASRIAGGVGIVTDRISGLVDSATVGDLRASVVDFRRTADRLARLVAAQSGRLDQTFENAAQMSDALLRTSGHLEDIMVRIDSSTRGGNLAATVADARSTSAALRSASADLELVSAMLADQRGRMKSILAHTDSLMTRINSGSGTLGLLARDSTLYREATLTLRQLRELLTDIQANPRRYFRFSVF